MLDVGVNLSTMGQVSRLFVLWCLCETAEECMCCCPTDCFICSYYQGPTL